MTVRKKVVLGAVAAAVLAVAAVVTVLWRPWQTGEPGGPAPAAPTAATNQPTGTIALPDATDPNGQESLTSEALVTAKAIQARKAQRFAAYIQDPKIRGGTLTGLCYVPFDKKVALYPEMPLDMTGANAIRDPKPGEAEYYRNRAPRDVSWLGHYHAQKKHYGVRGAVLIVEGVKAGRKGRFDRVGFAVDHLSRYLIAEKPQGQNVNNPSWLNIAFSFPGDLAQIVNYCLYDKTVTLTDTADGRTLETFALAGYKDPAHPGAHYGTHPAMPKPAMDQLPRITAPGLYRLASARYPWQKAYYFVVHSPYVALSNPENHYRRFAETGRFSITDVPAGHYTVRVWHPVLEPVRASMEVDIIEDEPTELAVAFKVPPALTKARPKLPDKTIEPWACVGPFEMVDADADRQVPRANFGAAYDGKYGRTAWRALQAKNRWIGLDGLLAPRTDGFLYFATVLEADRARRLRLRCWANALDLRFSLNGKPIHHALPGEILLHPGWEDRSVIIEADLKAGRNLLLIRAAGSGGGAQRLRVDYLSEGLTVKTPEIKPPKDGPDDNGSLVLDAKAHFRCYTIRGPMRLDGSLLKDPAFLKSRRDLGRYGLARIRRHTQTCLKARNIDWKKTDWRDHACWYPYALGYFSFDEISGIDQTPPPADWMKPEFDDNDWMMLWNTPTGKISHMVWSQYLRTGFLIPKDAAGKDLTLDLTYRGGVRVFVNGQELVRGHLPAGPLGPHTPAAPYGQDAYLAQVAETTGHPDPVTVPDITTSFVRGQPDHYNRKELANFRSPTVHVEHVRRQHVFLTRAGWDRIRNLRDRKLGPIKIPAKLLKSGLNTLAVEVRGSLFHPDVWSPGYGAKEPRLHWGDGWPHAELLALTLRDPAGKVPSAMAPAPGLKVWAEDMHTRVLNAHFRPAWAPAGTVRMVGPLNGVCSGMVVVRGDKPVTGLKVAVGDLKLDGGAAGISAGHFTVRGMVPRPLGDMYALDARARMARRDFPNAAFAEASFSPLVPARDPLEDPRRWRGKAMAKVRFFDHISDTVPTSVAAGQAQPLWISAQVPLDTAPGTYRGTVSVQADGAAAVAVPVRLDVVGWRAPNPHEFKTDVWLEQHPYAIAGQYLLPPKAKIGPNDRNWQGPAKAGVALWSDKHFKYMEKSFEILRRVGNDVIHIPLINRTEFGNWEDTPVRWIRGKDGQIRFDLSRMDRYLAEAQKHMGRLRVVDFVITHCMYSSRSSEVTVYDETTGKTELLNVGWSADAFERLALWKKLGVQLIGYMKSKGLESTIYWGHPGDYEPDPGLMGYFLEVFPGYYWSASGHSYGGGAGGGGHSRHVVRCFSDVYGAPKQLKSAMGWKGPTYGRWSNLFGDTRPENAISFQADETYLYIHNPRDYCRGPSFPIQWRNLPAHALRRGYSGLGRCGLDGFNADWLSGFAGSDWGFPGRPCNMLAWPGPEGAESSSRFEALLEGVQETEARIFLEQALDRKCLAGADAQAAQATLKKHLGPNLMHLKVRDNANYVYRYPWKDYTRSLFQTAAKVAEVVGVDVNKTWVKTKLPALGVNTRSFLIRNWTGKPRAWKAEASAPWIVLPRTSGSLLGFEEFVYKLDGKTLKPGQAVKGTITVTDTANKRSSVFEVMADVIDPVAVAYDHPHFNVRLGKTQTREFRVINRAAAAQDWKLLCPVGWIKIAPASGTLAPGAERIVKLTADPPKAQAVIENTFTLQAAGGLVKKPFLSKTFVIPLLREKEGRAMPKGKIIRVEDMNRYLDSAVFCKKGTVIEIGNNVREAGRARTRRFDKRSAPAMFRTPQYTTDARMGSTNTFIILIGKERFSRGMWVYPHHESVYKVAGAGITAFSAYVGVTRDARAKYLRNSHYRVNFEVYADGKAVAQSGLMSCVDAPRYVVAENLGGAKEIKLVTRLDCDKDDPTFLATWADAQFYAPRVATTGAKAATSGP